MLKLIKLSFFIFLFNSCNTTPTLLNYGEPQTFIHKKRHDYKSTIAFDSNKKHWVMVSSHWFPIEKLPIQSELLKSESKDLKTLSNTKPLLPEFSKKVYIYNPSFQLFKGKTYLYFMGTHKKGHKTAFYRSLFSLSTFQKPEKLNLEDKLDKQLRSFMEISASTNDELLLSYQFKNQKTKKSHLKLARSNDGINFKKTEDLGYGIMARATSFKSGPIVFTHQNGNPEKMMNFYQIKKINQNWSKPLPVSNKKDIHDAIPFRRTDGKVDLYYISPTKKDQYSIFRRTLSEDGSLTTEERITYDNAGSTEKPMPHRLPDGSIFITYAEQIEVGKIYKVNGIRISSDSTPPLLAPGF